MEFSHLSTVQLSVAIKLVWYKCEQISRNTVTLDVHRWIMIINSGLSEIPSSDGSQGVISQNLFWQKLRILNDSGQGIRGEIKPKHIPNQ